MSLYILIPLLPLAAFVTIGLGGRRWRIGVVSQRLAVPAMVGAFAISLIACGDVIANGPVFIPLYPFMQSGMLTINASLYFDALAVLLLCVVTGISALVHMYSSRYMQGDQRYGRFFALISLFTFSMIMLVLSDNMLLLFVFWEIMGICSYFLIGFWAERPPSVQAATKAFLVNAVADIGFGLGIIIAFVTFGSLDIHQIVASAHAFSGHTIDVLSLIGGEWHVSSLGMMCLLFFVGAMGKSAQFPFHGWLPSAMEAPTPVSALIHAATMVNAGVYLVVRLSPVFVLVPSVLTVVAVVGGTTALFAATVALTQNDIKRVLAFSTISQLGFMMFACGVGAFAAAVFHLVAHGMLKTYLFLSTGNVLQEVAARHVERTVRTPPWTLAVFTLVLAWLPLFILFSGPYERLWTVTLNQPAGWVFLGLASMTVFFTAYAVFRLVVAIFQHPMPMEWDIMSDPVDQTSKIASPAFVAGTAVATLGLGIALAFIWDGFSHALTPVLSLEGLMNSASDGSGGSPLWMSVAVVCALAGWGMAYYVHIRPCRPAFWMTEVSRTLYVLCLNRWHVDELYGALIARPTVSLARWLWHAVDVRGIDRLVSRMANVSISLAQWLLQVIDVHGIDRARIGLGHQTDTASHVLRKIDPQLLQQQTTVIIVWMVVAIGLLYWLIG